uniref:RxLR effector protein n=1 Tax=Globisporangium ultimum (strain ATCC 200006 / CBS 805.95 / DAOM BR144) TaxID=431595 RepID=K3XBC9_GLOUD
MLSTARFLALVAVVCSAVALNGATVSASGLENDPYTLPDGTVVDPTNENRSTVDEDEHTADPNQTLGESNLTPNLRDTDL